MGRFRSFYFLSLFFLLGSSDHSSAHNGAVAIALPVDGIEIDGDLSDWPASTVLHPIRIAELEAVVDSADIYVTMQAGYSRSQHRMILGLSFSDDYLLQPQSHLDNEDFLDADRCLIAFTYDHRLIEIPSFDYSTYRMDLPLAIAPFDSLSTNSTQAEWKGKWAATTCVYEIAFQLPDTLRSTESFVVGLDIRIYDHDTDGSESWVHWIGLRDAFDLFGDVLIVANDPEPREISRLVAEMGSDHAFYRETRKESQESMGPFGLMLTLVRKLSAYCFLAAGILVLYFGRGIEESRKIDHRRIVQYLLASYFYWFWGYGFGIHFIPIIIIWASIFYVWVYGEKAGLGLVQYIRSPLPLNWEIGSVRLAFWLVQAILAFLLIGLVIWVPASGDINPILGSFAAILGLMVVHFSTKLAFSLRWKSSRPLVPQTAWKVAIFSFLILPLALFHWDSHPKGTIYHITQLFALIFVVGSLVPIVLLLKNRPGGWAILMLGAIAFSMGLSWDLWVYRDLELKMDLFDDDFGLGFLLSGWALIAWAMTRINLARREDKRRREELEQARSLQLSLLPHDLPIVSAVDLAWYMETATEVGGDYYDYILSEDGTLTITLGDATGHGMQAGTVVTATKSLFQSYSSHPSITETFQVMSRNLKGMNLGRLGMAMNMVKIQDHKLQISSAGIPPALLYRSASKEIVEIEIGGVPLGYSTSFQYEQREYDLNAGDTLVLMSDGLPERLNPDDEELGYPKTQELFAEVAEKSPDEICQHLARGGDEWARGRPQDDDVTFVVLKVKG